MGLSRKVVRSRLSARAQEIRPFMVMEVLEKAFELERLGRSIVHLEVGEPDFDTPEVVREAGVRAIRDGHTHYTHSLGRIELREAIVRWQEERYGVKLSPEQVVVTLGSSGALLLTFAALLDPGDQVLLPDPCYACYPKFVRTLEGIPRLQPVSEASGFHLTADAVASQLQTGVRAVLLNSPSNPAGTVLPAAEMAALARACEDRTVVVSDEIYHGLIYEGEAHSIFEYTETAVALNGFSKLFAMTGWRLGYGIFPGWMVRGVQRLQQNLFISAPDFAQIAAVTALTEAKDEVLAMRREYDRRRRFALDRLAALGLRVVGHPAGAFYLLLDVAKFTPDVFRFSFELLEGAGVAVTPGTDFGPCGEGFIRLCYAVSLEKLEDGISRIGKYLEETRS